MSVGAVMRCSRFFSPLSGMGHTNFPVQASDQVVRSAIWMPVSGSGGGAAIIWAAGPVGSANSSGPRSCGAVAIQFATGASSRQSPTGSINASRLTRDGFVAATSAATIPPNECPTTAGLSSPSSSNTS